MYELGRIVELCWNVEYDGPWTRRLTIVQATLSMGLKTKKGEVRGRAGGKVFVGRGRGRGTVIFVLMRGESAVNPLPVPSDT